MSRDKKGQCSRKIKIFVDKEKKKKKNPPSLPATQSLPPVLEDAAMMILSSSGHFRISDVRRLSVSGWHVRRFSPFSPPPQIISATIKRGLGLSCSPRTSIPEFLGPHWPPSMPDGSSLGKMPDDGISIFHLLPSRKDKGWGQIPALVV
ncbi:hypothetical protein CEXT_323791 [Caerostris extrusa]|uniref:Uncharacterized protein n=1 Tax=Caerostris extrusa TaxID=172846 RepID=A0AAV4XA09_CAEEX|nr:hypothetical protein CEXT_323791 [Caerostris extrusa]